MSTEQTWDDILKSNHRFLLRDSTINENEAIRACYICDLHPDVLLRSGLLRESDPLYVALKEDTETFSSPSFQNGLKSYEDFKLQKKPKAELMEDSPIYSLFVDHSDEKTNLLLNNVETLHGMLHSSMFDSDGFRCSSWMSLPNIGFLFPNSERFDHHLNRINFIKREWMDDMVTRLLNCHQKSHFLAMSILEGPPGIGKSYFLMYFACRLIWVSNNPSAGAALNLSHPSVCVYIQNVQKMIQSPIEAISCSDYWIRAFLASLSLAFKNYPDIYSQLTSMLSSGDCNATSVLEKLSELSSAFVIFIVVDQLNAADVSFKQSSRDYFAAAAAFRGFLKEASRFCPIYLGADSDDTEKDCVILRLSPDYYYFTDVELLLYAKSILIGNDSFTFEEFEMIKEKSGNYPLRVSEIINHVYLKNSDISSYIDQAKIQIKDQIHIFMSKLKGENIYDQYVCTSVRALLKMPLTSDFLYDKRFIYLVDNILKFISPIEYSGFMDYFSDYVHDDHLYAENRSISEALLSLCSVIYSSPEQRGLLLEAGLDNCFHGAHEYEFSLELSSTEGDTLKLGTLTYEVERGTSKLVDNNAFSSGRSTFYITHAASSPMDDFLLLVVPEDTDDGVARLLKVRIVLSSITACLGQRIENIAQALGISLTEVPIKNEKVEITPTFLYLNSLKSALQKRNLAPKIYDVILAPPEVIKRYKEDLARYSHLSDIWYVPSSCTVFESILNAYRVFSNRAV